ncbi:F-box/FBD/LRR-repeat protein At1g13570-like [Rutidosis leptorrhynchoides]|uniref:F-box/FBD/LRR-repeat protein At1g13570-like n=1 Tax=Rutidosis leptorrhynchoides TaxID=125765 RepID=UPI003A98D438
MEPNCIASDVISSLPQEIVEIILSFVPTKHAVRTSILSKKWRYSWTRIPKLVFVEKSMIKAKMRKVLDAIPQVLSMHQGSILEFSLNMYSDDGNVEVDFDKIITYLSRKNSVTKLTLKLVSFNMRIMLPLSLFSLHQLTDLYLTCCKLDHQPPVNGFGMLTSLSLIDVDSTEELILDIVSKSPLLKNFSMKIDDYDDSCQFSHASMCELFGYIPAIERLYLSVHLYEFESSLPKLLTPLVHLKYVRLHDKCYIRKSGLSFFVFLIRSSPNLEKLKLQMRCLDSYEDDTDIDALTLEEYSDIWWGHLKELEVFLTYYADDELPELEYLKLILARSPVLKELNILISDDEFEKGAETKVLGVISNFKRASDTVKITVLLYTADVVLTVDEIYKVALKSLGPNIPGQIFETLSTPKHGDASYETFLRESKGILGLLRKRAQIMTKGVSSDPIRYDM